MMNASPRRLFVLCALLSAGAANARYLCAEPPTRVDRRACEAAREGPEELRQFVWRMNWLHHNLDFVDYVDEKTVMAWQQREQRTTALAAELAEVRN